MHDDTAPKSERFCRYSASRRCCRRPRARPPHAQSSRAERYRSPSIKGFAGRLEPQHARPQTRRVPPHRVRIKLSPKWSVRPMPKCAEDAGAQKAMRVTPNTALPISTWSPGRSTARKQGVHPPRRGPRPKSALSHRLERGDCPARQSRVGFRRGCTPYPRCNCQMKRSCTERSTLKVDRAGMIAPVVGAEILARVDRALCEAVAACPPPILLQGSRGGKGKVSTACASPRAALQVVRVKDRWGLPPSLEHPEACPEAKPLRRQRSAKLSVKQPYDSLRGRHEWS